ncbi:Zn(2)-Cys(6) zinc finger domain protein [Metarhizium robertsii]|uniref:Zn(2)-Cys(6) zinc finger domain protein n=1 Tax=Metarhizium robertsii TaxID=568076 RepID=A0A0A1UVH1_9HYPO|nr:Zn(2)-Cys(6) zinc finger domain protein [Metarhizium robertsii]
MEPKSCVVCRKRKVKCDRTPGSCRKCIKFGTECIYATKGDAMKPAKGHGHLEGTHEITQAGLRRRRIRRSCVECQRSKAKCSGDPLCKRCNRKGLHCLYPIQDPERCGSRSSLISLGDDRNGRSSHALVDTDMPTWLTSRSLPPAHRVRELLDIYLSQVHTVRCFGFLHIPTFMARFQDDDAFNDDRSGLIYILCALAAPFYYARAVVASSDQGPLPITQFHHAGRGWAASAMQCVCTSFGNLGVECLMVAVLLHEHFLRVGDHAKAFLMSGMVARHVQILQLNVEHDADILCEQEESIPWAVKESRRRLFWACYLQDAFIECGIDQLKFISTDDVQIQLPSLEDNFIRNKPCLTEMLRQGTILPFVQGSDVLNRKPQATDDLDLRALYIRAMAIRSRVLKYVKHLGDDIPWNTSQESGSASHFQRLGQELVALESSIPDAMRMAPENTYLYKSSGRLNLYFSLHILLAQTFNDLYRVGVAGLVYPVSATKWIRDNAPGDFLRRCHQMCATKAAYIATLLDDLYKCHKESMVDMPFAMHAQVCSGVLVTTLASWIELGESATSSLLPEAGLQQFRQMLESNVRVLQHLRAYMQVDLFLESAAQAMKRFDKITEQNRTNAHAETEPTEDQNPRQFSLDYILNPLGVYPIARTQASDGHKPEQFASSAAAKVAVGSTTSSKEWESCADDVMSLDGHDGHDAFQYQSSGLWDWELQTPMLELTGYPTFLDDAFLGQEIAGVRV